MSERSRFGYLLTQLILRDLRTRYRQTLIGAAWGLGRPLAELGIFAFVFRGVLKAPSDGLPYALFAFTGVMLWTLVAGGISAGIRSVTNHGGLVSRVPFDALTLPLASVGSALVDLLVSGVLLIGLMIWYHVPATPALLGFVPVLLVLCGLVAGIAIVGAAVHVFYHDLGYATDIGMRLWQLATPLAYAASAIPLEYREYYRLNPLVGVFEAARGCLLAGQWPTTDQLLYPAVLATVLVGGGLLLFRACQPYFAESV